MNRFNGMNIVSSVLARDIRTEWRVERNPIRKRRRNWRVVRHVIDKPGCYQMGDTLIMHPELIARLGQALPAPPA